MPSRAAKAARSSSAAARLGSTPGAGLTRTSAPTLGMLLPIAQRLGCGGRHGDEVIRRRQGQPSGERLEIFDEHVVAEFSADLFRQPRAALVVAQYAKMLCQFWRDAIPRIERTAKLMHQHGRPASPARA